MTRTVTIFYAWQSDSPKATNRNGIKAALSEAISAVEGEFSDTTIVVDEATRNESGSINIPDKIREKIEACDIFLGDVTTIDPSTAVRKTPNPNVTFEVGYAAAILGWERMILVSNTAYGQLSDLPFDFDRQRISQYNWLDGKHAKKVGVADLSKMLVDAIGAVISKDPKKRIELFGQSPEKIRRERDLENIRWLLSSFPISVAQVFAQESGTHLHHQQLHYQEAVEAIVMNQHFHIYDKDLDKVIRAFSKHWSKACSYGHRYHALDNHPLIYRFDLPGQRHSDPKVMEDLKRIERAKAKMAEDLSKLLNIVRERYVEIDATELSKQAHASWQDLAEEAGFKKLGLV